MKKTVPLCLVLVFFLLAGPIPVFSCSIVLPPEAIIRINGDDVCYFERSQDYLDLNSLREHDKIRVDETRIMELCPGLMNEADKNVVFSLLERGLRQSIYERETIKIEKQTNAEYSEFQNEIEKVNSAVCDCSRIYLHERQGVWTMYSQGVKDSCGDPCYGQYLPLYCPNAYFQHLGPLLIVACGIIAGSFFLFRKIKKREKRKK